MALSALGCSADKTPGQANAEAIARKWVASVGVRDPDKATYEAEPRDSGWWVSIQYLPPTVGAHTDLEIDANGQVIVVHPGAWPAERLWLGHGKPRPKRFRIRARGIGVSLSDTRNGVGLLHLASGGVVVSPLTRPRVGLGEVWDSRSGYNDVMLDGAQLRPTPPWTGLLFMALVGILAVSSGIQDGHPIVVGLGIISLGWSGLLAYQARRLGLFQGKLIAVASVLAGLLLGAVLEFVLASAAHFRPWPAGRL
jgi:hypothetical protein